MECPRCHAEISDHSKFCNQCGAALLQQCGSCGHVNPPGSNFCSECGFNLTGAQPLAATPSVELPMSAAERRHLTVLFCDIVGSTELSTRLDVEDLRDVIGEYQNCVTKIMTGFGGFVARFLGDGALVFFGYPQAHEDDPEQAVRAGLDVIDAISRLDTPEALQVRIGIATGLAVVGDLFRTGAQEQEIVGEVPNLAARLQTRAKPNTVIIAESTRRLLGSTFELEDLGEELLKGIAQPQRIWRVVGGSQQIRSRFEAFHSAETPLVGRDEEIELLTRRWAQAKAGEGRVVLLAAEPGIGKSRLVTALEHRLHGEPCTSLRYFCSSHYQDSALHPIITQIERAAEFDRGDLPDAKLTKLQTLLTAASTSSEDMVLFAELLSLPKTGASVLDHNPQLKKEKIFEALLRQIESLSRKQPVLMIFEDIHWIDPTSRELLDLGIDRLANSPVLLIMTFRSGFQVPWEGLPHVTTLVLRRLGNRESEAIVRQLTANTSLPRDLLQEIVDRADGVPLFLEEVTKAVLESGDDADQVLSKVPGRRSTVPSTLQASLMARLDRLGTVAKEIAQIGATIGREFSYELLAAVANKAEPQLREGVERLLEAGLVFRRGHLPRADFLFKHALVQDAAYGTLLRDVRRSLHALIAEAIEEKFPDVTATRPELVARHLTEAGRIERATPYRVRAGELALRTSAIGEAVTHFSLALQTIQGLANTPERLRQELDIRLGLGTALNISHGSSHPDVRNNYARAVELGRSLEPDKKLFRALWGSWYTVLTSGQREQALTLANELVALSEQLDDRDLMLEAHHSRWASAHVLGLNVETLSDTERGLALYVPARHHAHTYEYGGHDTGVCAYSHKSVALWFMGFPEQASQMCDKALELGRSLGHPPSLAHAAWWSATTRQLLREPELCRELAELTIRIAEEQGSNILLMAPLLVGWVKYVNGEIQEGLDRMEKNVERARQSARRFYYDYELLVFAEALLEAGFVDKANEVVDEALKFIEATSIRLFMAEGCRLKGACLAALGGEGTEVATWLERAIDIADRQQALSLKLRAAMTLMKVQGAHGRAFRARQILDKSYRSFTEGFDTPALKQAKALLDDSATLCL